MSNNYRREDIEFMSEVDAALRHRGHPYAYLLSVAIIVTFAVFCIWAHFAVLDEVTRGMGSVIPSQRLQEMQNLEGGILQEVLVHEGQIVEKDQVLVRIDNEQARSIFRDASSKILEHEAAIIRLEAEASGTDPVYSPELREKAPTITQDQLNIFHARKEQLLAEIRVFDAQRYQKQQEVEEMISRRKQLVQSHKIAAERRNIARPLMEKNVYPRVDYLQLEESLLKLQGDIDSLSLGIPRASRAAEEAKARLEQRMAEFRNQAQEEINKRRAELRSLRESLTAGEDRVTRTDIRAPMRGTIKRINHNTIGGVIRPGDTILELVPLDDTLLIETRIRPADIAFLHPGQRAMVKITAYDFSIYGGLEAIVEQISADTIEDRKGENFYLVKLRTKTNTIIYRGQKLPIIPGMTATVDILTGKKSVLDYMLKPILKAKQNALRER
ncbi:HlyD family type I secretion periplasmic adaptor subunit [Desulfovibrio subterraneus]|jgi:adhesin transport system membrane fusion protein|uniref:HlyD family type I secretion membrane fusion protein n=1 Tax=Desulfovibrio subterraneus TaxID=2718620 RepID=A0A7J0BQA8_9BACT|nr:HlyD family type I secretion periplasmic adaptor subunit [Desulfovibrio subterraneus]WBF69202.1 HlyD family type I secretion periplasmic adaptor subunit [Desulfovibrio subterraneus]GFM35315.1 HlyD family type I secretion membrane fusion protein [Desulfovibrio subterraneus]